MISRSSDTDLQGRIKDIRGLINGNGEYSDWNVVEKIGTLQKWVDRLEDWADAVEHAAEVQGSEDAEDIAWPRRVREVVAECERAIESYSKDHSERSMEEKLYPGMPRED